jgi:ribosomal protein S10
MTTVLQLPHIDKKSEKQSKIRIHKKKGLIIETKTPKLHKK